MSVRTTIDIPDELHAVLRQRAAAEHTSIRSLIVESVRRNMPLSGAKRVTGPLVGNKAHGHKDKPAAGSPDRENPYDVLFA
jgi:hypothetical protein